MPTAATMAKEVRRIAPSIRVCCRKSSLPPRGPVGEPEHPFRLLRGLDRLRPIRLPDPRDRLGAGTPGKHGHTREHGPGPAAAAEAADLDEVALARPVEGGTDVGC